MRSPKFSFNKLIVPLAIWHFAPSRWKQRTSTSYLYTIFQPHKYLCSIDIENKLKTLKINIMYVKFLQNIREIYLYFLMIPYTYIGYKVTLHIGMYIGSVSKNYNIDQICP